MLSWLALGLLTIIFNMMGLPYLGMAMFSIIPVSLVLIIIINLINKFKKW
jgi:hypothetical protein